MIRELAELYEEDQRDREDDLTNASPEQCEQIEERDQRRRARVAEIVNEGILESPDDYYHAAGILQHGNEPEHFLLAHVLATAAAFLGHGKARRFSATTLDRFLHFSGRPQLFGCNKWRTTGSGPYTMEPYEHSFPDAIRRIYDVPSLEEQLSELEKKNLSVNR